jgi:polysaccharide pyruvyl transferase WcaK-like protein
VTRAIHTVADPAFLVEPDMEAADAILSENGLAGREIIGVCLRPWPGHEGWQAELCQGIGRAAAEIGAGVAAIPMQEPDDLACGDIPGAVVVKNVGGPRAVKGLISRCGLVVGMRLHSLIFAAGESTPFLPIVYDPKVGSFARSAGVEMGLSLDVVTAEGVRDAVVNAWRNREDTRACLAGRAAEWERLALAPVEMLRELIER